MEPKIYKLEDFERVMLGFRTLARKKEASLFARTWLKLMKKVQTDESRLGMLACLSAIMYLMEPVSIVVDLEGEQGIERIGEICAGRYSSFLLSNYLAKLKLVSDPVEKEGVLNEMRMVCIDYQPFRRALIYAGFPDEYEEHLSFCRSSDNQFKTVQLLEEK